MTEEDTKKEVVPGTVTALLVEESGRKVGLVEVEGVIGSEDNEPMKFNDKVSQLVNDGAEEIKVRVNSPGGCLFTGLAMHDTLKGCREKGIKVTAVVMGLAASAATVVIMGADEITMTENSQLMVHEPATWLFGKVTELKKDLAELEAAWDNMVAIYTARTGAAPDVFKADHSKDVWYSAEQAVAAKLADAIVNPLQEGKPVEAKAEEAERVKATFVDQVAQLAARAGQYIFRRKAAEPSPEQKLAAELAAKTAECEKLQAELAGVRESLAVAKADRLASEQAAEAARAEAAAVSADNDAEIERRVAARVAGMGLPASVELPAPTDPAGLTAIETAAEVAALEDDAKVRGWLNAKAHAKVMLYASQSASACAQVQRLLGN